MSAGPVLVVDDDPKIVELVRTYLERAGYEVITAADGEDALRRAEQTTLRVIVLDVMLPGVDGFLLTRYLRDSHNRVPILMMSARGTVDDRIRGLVQGADDYLPKPFSPAELVERVNAIVRRTTPGDLPNETLKHGDLEVDIERHEVRRRGSVVQLTDVEFRVLVALFEAEGRVLKRNHLIEVVYGMDSEILGRTVDVVIRRLRIKLTDDFESPRYIATVRGAGYRMAPLPIQDR